MNKETKLIAYKHIDIKYNMIHKIKIIKEFIKEYTSNY